MYQYRPRISLGVTSVIPDENTDPDELISRADKALYMAKAVGRNRVTVWGKQD